MFVDRDSASVVLDGNRPVDVDDDGNIGRKTGEGLVDRIVDTKWCKPRVPTSPMYIDGRTRT